MLVHINVNSSAHLRATLQRTMGVAQLKSYVATIVDVKGETLDPWRNKLTLRTNHSKFRASPHPVVRSVGILVAAIRQANFYKQFHAPYRRLFTTYR